MSDQVLDLRRSWQIVRRRWAVVLIVGVLGAGAGAGFALLDPPQLTSNALVGLQTASKNLAATQVVIAGSDPVLTQALPDIPEHMTVPELKSAVQVTSLTTNIISISGTAPTAGRAEAITNAVARSYVSYVRSTNTPGGVVQARVFQTATSAAGRPLTEFAIITGGLGLIIGALLGSIGVLAVSRRDRRLRERDQIADSIGVPVLASVDVERPSDAAGWAKLLADYEPDAVAAWRLRGILRQLGLPDSGGPGAGRRRSSLLVLSLRHDPKALALGPQLAAFASSLGVRTALVLGPKQDLDVTATLRAACLKLPGSPAALPENLQVVVQDESSALLPEAAFTVVTAVVDERSPHVAGQPLTTCTVLGVSAGAVTAEDLARVAVSAADDGRLLAGILVADPDSADTTTGRMPQPTRDASRRQPTHLTGISTETRRWMMQNRR